MRHSIAQHRAWGLVALALLALSTGVSVYLFDRPPGSASLIPAFLQLDSVGTFGNTGAWLPSLLHIYAFILLTAAVVQPDKTGLLLVCTGWLSIELFFELIQHPLCVEFFTGRTGSWLEGTPGMAVLHHYAAAGVFDPLDLGALGLGAVAAYVTARLARKTEESS